ncbi:hypothetical protein AB9K26_04615 [Psychroserpens sp. XS_ASV72]|uniref:hypothetical protein n=1 Tax=Psychroserpens sp. XS_ASV72 TaxID=3241293 RepID=UPI003517A1D4
MIKHLTILFTLFICVSSCNSEKKERKPISVQTTQLSVAEKIAKAHGLEHWNNVNRIEFTFQVDRNGQQGNGRAWTWFPKKDSVIMQAGEQYVKYNRSQMDSVPPNADQAFINDKFWLLIPFQLVWDEGTTISEPKTETAPISKSELNKITLTYGSEGGYTPGDAYDIFYDDNFIIREWVFRQGNSQEPTMSTTFENYKNFGGLRLAQEHKMEESDFNLRFTNINVN